MGSSNNSQMHDYNDLYKETQGHGDSQAQNAQEKVDSELYDNKTSSFVSSYVEQRTQGQFEELLAHARNHCELLLKSIDVKGAVHGRIKDPESLRKKLKDLKNDSSLKLNFRDWVVKGNDIYEHPDMGDLAGVRIGLYFPTDVAKVEKKMKESFKQIHSFGTVTEGRLPTSRETDVRQYGRGRWYTVDANNAIEFWNHSGYESWQMVVKWKDPLGFSLESVRTGMHENFKSLKFEVQVGTVVSQAWAEVQHNIIYKKPDDILATSTMKRMIDAINGLAITTDIMLKELARSLEDAKKEAEDAKQKHQQTFQSLKTFVNELAVLDTDPNAANLAELSNNGVKLFYTMLRNDPKLSDKYFQLALKDPDSVAFSYISE
ncbi:uncharacterized protein PAC_09793 [Phialocephala subalpina]|uniref:RelA/SpoT domain-containing protein n=1 Tax=Phialocephala subalpina TaxID=576137 RepID=A0A1L7X4E8_9HELO|nr:uncharacterized protein PAC_09793 [Phialocephala subalpina]